MFLIMIMVSKEIKLLYIKILKTMRGVNVFRSYTLEMVLGTYKRKKTRSVNKTLL